MITINKILLPTDFSDQSRKSYSYANDFALKFGGQVDLFHVIPAVRYFEASIKRLGLPLDIDKDVYPHIQQDVKEQGNRELSKNFDKTVQGTFKTMIMSSASAGIEEVTEDDDYDIIIMGAQGSGDTHLLSGSVTDKVLRRSDVPVLTVPKDAKKEKIRRILIPIDFSDVSMESLPFTLTMAAQLGAEVTLFHVLEIFGSESENKVRNSNKHEVKSINDLLLDTFDEYLNEQNQIEARLERLPYELYDELIIKDDENEYRIRLFTHVNKGISSHYEITGYAEDRSDLIVLTTHGRSGLSHLLLGSTAEKVVQHSNKPVLTFRPGKFRS